MNFRTKSGRNEQLTATSIEDEENSSSSLSNISRAPKIKRKTRRIKNILHKNDDVEYTYDASFTGYLNDTTWFASSKEQINQSRTVAKINQKLNSYTIELIINDKPANAENIFFSTQFLIIHNVKFYWLFYQQFFDIQIKSQLNITLSTIQHPLLLPIALQKLDILQRKTPKWFLNRRLSYSIKDSISIINRTHKAPKIVTGLNNPPKSEMDITLEQSTEDGDLWKKVIARFIIL
ncbi:hypothetical protein C1646_759743 [Rhizophagus diaphanus]|nr:hypothetical protein C1646_759743 [Rhizophagus diaphanus] [Rhizophagus sp. MUCL 43196]